MKAAIIHVSPSMFIEICKGIRQGFIGGFEVTENPLPADAKPVDVFYDNGRLNIVIESETFDDIPEGEDYPILPPTMVTARPW